MVRISAFCLLFGLFGTALAAQTWQVQTEDDGAFAYGFAGVPNFMGLYCLAPSPTGGGDAAASAFAGTMPSAPGQLMMELGLPIESQADMPAISLQVGGRSYELPLARFSEPTGMVFHPLDRSDPMIESLQAANTVRIRGGERLLLSLPLRASRRSIDAMLAFCDTVDPMPEAAAEAAPGQPLRDDAFFEDRLQAACGGPVRKAADYLLRADLDGDGQEDAILDWGRITCGTEETADPGAGTCRGTQCRVEIFLARDPEPHEVLSSGAAVRSDADGSVLLELRPAAALCKSAIAAPCRIVTRYAADGTRQSRIEPLP